MTITGEELLNKLDTFLDVLREFKSECSICPEGEYATDDLECLQSTLEDIALEAKNAAKAIKTIIKGL